MIIFTIIAIVVGVAGLFYAIHLLAADYYGRR